MRDAMKLIRWQREDGKGFAIYSKFDDTLSFMTKTALKGWQQNEKDTLDGF